MQTNSVIQTQPSAEAPELTCGWVDEALQDFIVTDNTADLRFLDQYSSGDLMCLLLAISQVSDDKKNTLGEMNIRILEKWSHRINAAMNNALTSESGRG